VAAEKSLPGWLLLSMLNDKPTWSEVREIKDRIHLYLPDGDKPVRGVFACFVFHSGDPRELADLWNFALVTVPWPFEYDLGVNAGGKLYVYEPADGSNTKVSTNGKANYIYPHGEATPK